MGLPRNYLKSAENAIASYDYYDLAEKTGKQLFYGAAQAISGQTLYVLTQNQIYSSPAKIEITTLSTSGAGYYKDIDLDFDLTAFNAPQAIRGTAIINFQTDLNAVGTDSECAFYFKTKLRKWNPTTSTETEIAEAITPNIGGASGSEALNSIPIVIPKTSFKRGEILRLTMEGWANEIIPGNHYRISLGTDPMNRDGTYIIPSTDTNPITTTQLKIWVPFNLDL